MHYKFFRYKIEHRGQSIDPSEHHQIFNSARGPDDNGEYAYYRGQKNSVLMHVRQYANDFTGRIGKHSTDREVTRYNAERDLT